jgi:hypothetical protein
MKTADHDLSACEPDVIVTNNPRQVIVRARLLEQTPEGPQKSDKYIHLTLTTAEAMQLMNLLQDAQSKNSLWTDARGQQ